MGSSPDSAFVLAVGPWANHRIFQFTSKMGMTYAVWTTLKGACEAPTTKSEHSVNYEVQCKYELLL